MNECTYIDGEYCNNRGSELCAICDHGSRFTWHVQPQLAPEVCEWKKGKDPFTKFRKYLTGCGEISTAWPKENNYTFCPFCGKPIRIKEA